jgi:hypothetical protein
VPQRTANVAVGSDSEIAALWWDAPVSGRRQAVSACPKMPKPEIGRRNAGGDCGIDKGLSDRLQAGEGAFLVDPLEARHIRNQHGGQPPLHPFSEVG